MRIKKDDIVLVRTGNSSGQRGRVLSVDHAKRKIVVEGGPQKASLTTPDRG